MASTPVAPSKHLSEARVAIPQHVVHRAFPAETVLLNLDTGQYHGLNPTAGRMFELLGESEELNQVARRLSKELEQPLEVVAKDLHDLCLGLIGRGLLEAVTD